jgi:hypothetical protein
MTVACLTLLGQAQRPIWPFAANSSSGLVVEAFPAAQLRVWNLPFDRYNGSTESARNRRWQILEGLRTRIDIKGHDEDLLASADAMDAVLCTFAGVAVKRSVLARPAQASIEGWIAVHDQHSWSA